MRYNQEMPFKKGSEIICEVHFQIQQWEEHKQY